MLKSEPANSPTPQPSTLKHPAPKQMAAPIDEPAPAHIVDPLATVKAGGELDQRESSIRRAHRLRMKEFFSRARSAS